MLLGKTLQVTDNRTKQIGSLLEMKETDVNLYKAMTCSPDVEITMGNSCIDFHIITYLIWKFS